MTDPATLSASFLDGFNRRDLDLLEQLVAPVTDYRRASSPTLGTPAEVRARYAQDFELSPDIHAELTEVIAASDTDVAFEIVVTVAGISLTGAAHHRWLDGRTDMVRPSGPDP